MLDIPLDDLSDEDFENHVPRNAQRAQKVVLSRAIKQGEAAPNVFIMLGAQAKFDALYAQKPHVKTLAVGKNIDFWWEKLNEFGYEHVAEFIANGNLPVEFAKHHGIPLLIFTKWWMMCPKATSNAAKEASAQVHMIKAEMAVSLAAPDETTALLAKELSKLMSERAKALDPNSWSGKVKADGAAKSINIVLGEGVIRPAQVQYSPPIEALRLKQRKVRRHEQCLR
jgi:hypothetical protein